MRPDFTPNTIASLCERLDILPLATIAALLGIGPQTLKNYRSGNREAPSHVVLNLAELVRVIEGYMASLEEKRTAWKNSLDLNENKPY